MNDDDRFLIQFINNQPIIYIKDSLKINAGLGVFAKTFIPMNQPIIVYYGDIISQEDTLTQYFKDKNKYCSDLAPYLRHMNNHLVINGKTALDLDNINLHGCLVNDYSNLDNGIDIYLHSVKNCNVTINDSLSYPIYYSNRDIYPNEELYAHYGLPYWLLLNGMEPSKIEDYINNNKYLKPE